MVPIEEWWPRLKPESRNWLVAHNGDVVTPAIAEEIAGLAGTIGPDAWWVGDAGPTGFQLSDAAVDWIEAVANEETPEGP